MEKGGIMGALFKLIPSATAMDSIPIKLHYLPMNQVLPARTHGFSKQRMVVVPEPVWKRLGNHPLLKGIRVTDAGFFPKASGHLVCRNNGADTEILIACVEGEGSVQINDCDFSVRPGNLVWIPSKTAHRYTTSRLNPWTILWVHFTGSEIECWRKLIFGETSGPVCRIPVECIGELSLDRIHATLEKGYSLLNLIEAATAMRNSLGLLAKCCQQSGFTLSARSRVASSIEKLRNNCTLTHRIDELAAQTGISVSHFSAIFKKETGFSPIDFLIRQRIQYASQLLVTSQEPISVVATIVGYDDPYFFSRSFRKIMGCSPRAYRTQNRS